MRLGPEVVHLIGSNMVEYLGQRVAVGQVAIVKGQPGIRFVRIEVEMVDSLRAESGGPANDAMDAVSLGQKQLGEVGTVLSGDSGDQCCLAFRWRPFNRSRPMGSSP